jgi:hypothetical protein
MEGLVYFKKSGVLKGYNKYFAKIDTCKNDFVLRKKSYDGKEYLRFNLTEIMVYPIVVSQIEFLLVHKEKLYKLRCESPLKRY